MMGVFFFSGKKITNLSSSSRSKDTNSHEKRAWGQHLSKIDRESGINMHEGFESLLV
jgi:hypothetical protein